MESRNKILKSKRLKLIRGVMYLDVLSILLSVMMIDMRHFTFSLYSGVCMRILVLLGIFILLLIGERSLTRYLAANIVMNEKRFLREYPQSLFDLGDTLLKKSLGFIRNHLVLKILWRHRCLYTSLCLAR